MQLSFPGQVQCPQLAPLLHKHEILLSVLLSSGLGVAVLVWTQLTHLRWGTPQRGTLPSLCQPALRIPRSLHDGQLPALLRLAKTKLRVCLPCRARSCLSAGLWLTAASSLRPRNALALLPPRFSHTLAAVLPRGSSACSDGYLPSS